VSQCLLVLGPPTASPPPAQGPWQMIAQAPLISAPYGAWVLPIPGGSSAGAVAVAFVETLKLPIGTVAYLIDMTGAPACCEEFTLAANWTQIPITP
jgi:hypothetical protein